MKEKIMINIECENGRTNSVKITTPNGIELEYIAKAVVIFEPNSLVQAQLTIETQVFKTKVLDNGCEIANFKALNKDLEEIGYKIVPIF
jgi:hypothetical protein